VWEQGKKGLKGKIHSPGKKNSVVAYVVQDETIKIPAKGRVPYFYTNLQGSRGCEGF